MKCEPIRPDQIAHEVFLVAERFSVATNVLGGSARDLSSVADVLPGHDVHLLLALPSIVLEAFSAELYLKSLHAVSGTIPPPKGHDLLKLYRGLSPQLQMEISKRYVNSDPLKQSTRFRSSALAGRMSMSLEDKLKEASDVFADVRYPWEHDFRVQNFDVGHFRAIVREAILARRPQFVRVLKTMRISGHVFTPCGPHCRGLLSVHHRGA